jgi:hypothetical protein
MVTGDNFHVMCTIKNCKVQTEEDCGVRLVFNVACLINKWKLKTVGLAAEGVKERLAACECLPGSASTYLDRVRLVCLLMQADKRFIDPRYPVSLADVDYAKEIWNLGSTLPKNPTKLSLYDLQTMNSGQQMSGEALDACLDALRALTGPTSSVFPVHIMASVQSAGMLCDPKFTVADKVIHRFLPSPTLDVRLKKLYVPVCEPTTSKKDGHYYLLMVIFVNGQFKLPFEVYNSSPLYVHSADWKPDVVSRRLHNFLIFKGYTSCEQKANLEAWGAKSAQDGAFSTTPLNSLFYLVCVYVCLVVFCSENTMFDCIFCSAFVFFSCF